MAATTYLKNTLLVGICFFCCSPETFAQYQTKKTVSVGLLFEGNFSVIGQHGFTPSLTVGNDCHQFQIGPRFGFANWAGNRNKYQLFFDLGYRINYFTTSWVSLFGSFRTEYGHGNFDQTWIYDAENPATTQNGYLGEGKFTANYQGKSHDLAFYLGAGAEFNIMDNVYVKAEGLFGMIIENGEGTYSNVDTGEQISNSKYLIRPGGTSWMGSVGLGYRF